MRYDDGLNVIENRLRTREIELNGRIGLEWSTPRIVGEQDDGKEEDVCCHDCFDVESFSFPRGRHG